MKTSADRYEKYTRTIRKAEREFRRDPVGVLLKELDAVDGRYKRHCVECDPMDDLVKLLRDHVRILDGIVRRIAERCVVARVGEPVGKKRR